MKRVQRLARASLLELVLRCARIHSLHCHCREARCGNRQTSSQGSARCPRFQALDLPESLDRRPDVRRGSSSPNQPHGSLRCKLHRLKSRPFHPSHRHGSGPDRSEVAGPCPHDGHQDTGSSLSKVQRESHRLPCVLRKLCAWNVQADGPSAREFLGHAAMLDAQGALSMPNPL